MCKRWYISSKYVKLERSHNDQVISNSRDGAEVRVKQAMVSNNNDYVLLWKLEEIKKDVGRTEEVKIISNN